VKGAVGVSLSIRDAAETAVIARSEIEPNRLLRKNGLLITSSLFVQGKREVDTKKKGRKEDKRPAEERGMGKCDSGLAH